MSPFLLPPGCAKAPQPPTEEKPETRFIFRAHSLQCGLTRFRRFWRVSRGLVYCFQETKLTLHGYFLCRLPSLLSRLGTDVRIHPKAERENRARPCICRVALAVCNRFTGCTRQAVVEAIRLDCPERPVPSGFQRCTVAVCIERTRQITAL